jgi:hypothetical protein
MSIRNQPYLPLYVQDFLTDEKLAECSAMATGVYIRLMCLMHKSEEYGKILLKQKDKVSLGKTAGKKETFGKVEWFANKVSKHFPYDFITVRDALNELLSENVLQIEGDFLVQKRMVKDAEISTLRSKVGKKGGDKTASHFAQAKPQPNAEYESEYDNDINKGDSLNTEVGEIPKGEEGKKSVYQQCVDLYFEFYKGRSDGLPPKFEKKHGEAMKSIISHLTTSVKHKQPELKPPEVESEVVKSFSYILSNWDKQTDFIKQQTDLTSINSNFNRIITDLKNPQLHAAHKPTVNGSKQAGAIQLLGNIKSKLGA